MSYRLRLARSAQKKLQSLPRDLALRIDRKILSLQTDPRPPGTKKLSGEDEIYRARVGAYRIVYQIKDDQLIVLVIRIGHRKDVYR